MAKGKKKSGKVKTRNTEVNKIRRINSEIKECEKKIEKLLRFHSEGRKRWTTDEKGNKVELDKVQGFAKDSARHKALLAHIKFLKEKV